MTEILAADTSHLRRAVASGDDKVQFTLTLPREVAQKVLTLLDEERKDGAVVLPAAKELRTTQVATILGVSRQTVARMIERGEIDSHTVGTHHRVPAHALTDYLNRVSASKEANVRAFMDAQNELGFFE